MSDLSMIGAYGAWAASLAGDGPAALSFRRPQWSQVDPWRMAARSRVAACLASPDTGGPPAVTVERTWQYDGLEMEELSWQLPYGPRTSALLAKPAGARDPLPGVLALHDHSGVKFFGWPKIAQAADAWHPVARQVIDELYQGRPWVNALARRGYAVLAHDAFAFGSRRVRLADVPAGLRPIGVTDDDERSANVTAYNQWAGGHEHIMAKSLLAAGATWPGVWLAEDQRALDVLCARPDVDAERVGCCGLSGGGLRTAYLGGMDDRIQAAVCVGMMTTWRDYVLNKSANHTWMVYIPHLAQDLDYPEIFGLRVPKPTMVLNDRDDQLFTLEEMKRADGMLQEIFEKAGAGDRYCSHIYPGPHKFDREMQDDAFAWFDQWLR